MRDRLGALSREGRVHHAVCPRSARGSRPESGQGFAAQNSEPEMVDLPKAEIEKWFGSQFLDEKVRLESYDLLEAFIQEGRHKWKGSAPTERIAKEFDEVIEKMDDASFAFLLCHTGYIPETYEHDSSEETLFSKLVEILVGSWAKRVGFTATTLPTAKSSVEDVTISDGVNLIVCDAKTFRLGRSQKAPNVKDALKQGDILKWLERHPKEQRLGGLVTFPSQHDWSSGSDVYQYLTDKSSPITLLFYEHLSLMLRVGEAKDHMVSYFKNHGDLFPKTIGKKERNREAYFLILHRELVSRNSDDWRGFYPAADFIIRERVTHAIRSLKSHLGEIGDEVKADVAAMAEEDLRKELIQARTALRCERLIRQIDNIARFRSTLS